MGNPHRTGERSAFGQSAAAIEKDDRGVLPNKRDMDGSDRWQGLWALEYRISGKSWNSIVNNMENYDDIYFKNPAAGFLFRILLDSLYFYEKE